MGNICSDVCSDKKSIINTPKCKVCNKPYHKCIMSKKQEYKYREYKKN